MRNALLFLLFAGFPALTAEYYASSIAMPNGDGSINTPWPLRTALAHPSIVRPGDTIWLRGGIYRGRFVSTLAGQPGNPIIVRAYPGEWVTLDGNSGVMLLSAVSSSDTTLSINDASDLRPASEIVIDQEIMSVRSLSGNRLTVIRGWSGTTAAAHATSATVKSKGGVLGIGGHDTWFWGFEVMSSDPQRVTTMIGSTPAEIARGTGVDVRTERIKLINLVIHDAADAVGLWESALDAEVYGCLTYHSGWQGPDRGHGHGLYIQNRTGRKLVSDVISFNNFATGMKIFGEAGYAIGVDFDGVISFNNGSVRDARQIKETNLYVGTGSTPADLINITNSVLYHTPGRRGENLHIGYVSANKRVTVVNNYVAAGSDAISLTQWDAAVVRGNTFYLSSLGAWGDQTMAVVAGEKASTYDWNGNTYYDGAPAFNNGMRYTFTFNGVRNQLGGGRLSFAEWQRASGFDSSSHYEPNPPRGAYTAVRPNTYETGRANIAIFNWSEKDSVEVDLSKVLKIGDTYTIRDAQNYYGEAAAAGVYDGQPVVIPMKLTRIARPIGNVPTVPGHTAPLFGAFVVVSQGPGEEGSVGRGGTSYRPLPFGRRPRRLAQ